MLSFNWRREARLISEEKNTQQEIFPIERLVLIVILLIQSFIDQQRFLFPRFPASNRNQMAFRISFGLMLLLFSLSLPLLVCSISPKGLRQLVNVDDLISNNSPYCIIARAHARIDSRCSTPAKEKKKRRENIQSNNLLISSRDRRVIHDNHAVSVYLFFISTQEIIIKKKKKKSERRRMNSKD